MNLVYSIPAGLLLLVALALAIAAVGVGQIFVHRKFSHRELLDHNEVGGILIVVSGTIYAVILGFLTVVAWQHFTEARDIVVAESDADIDAWHTAIGLPDAVRRRVRADMVQYADFMIKQEWSGMRRGQFNEIPAIISMDAMDAVGGFVPANSGEANAQVATLQQLNVLHDGRQRRIAMNESGVSWFEWLVLLIGASCVICFCWLFCLRNPRTQLTMTATVAILIVSILVLLFELQFPFRSNIAIGPEAWQRASAHIQEMETGHLMNMRM
ncbi:MAG TPA: hypothetical protein VKB67_04510 [Rhizomicrobium sp.]|nr:hypothetical protein [Rhizomicrobium sp.]